jgi:hypothetical protein
MIDCAATRIHRACAAARPARMIVIECGDVALVSRSASC